MLVCMLVFVCLLPLNVVVLSPVLCQRSISQSTYTRPHPPIQACRLRTMLVVLAVMSTCQAFALTWCRSVALPRMGAAWRCLVDSIQPFSSADRTRRQQGGSALLVRAASSVPDAMYVPRFVRSAGWKLIALNHYHNPCIHTHTPCTSRSPLLEHNREEDAFVQCCRACSEWKALDPFLGKLEGDIAAGRAQDHEVTAALISAQRKVLRPALLAAMELSTNTRMDNSQVVSGNKEIYCQPAPLRAAQIMIDGSDLDACLDAATALWSRDGWTQALDLLKMKIDQHPPTLDMV